MFSVVIPAYNCEKTIYDTLESVYSQTRRDLIDEIVIVNDGSVDNTKKIIEGFISDHGQIECRLINQNNSGVSVARNRGIREAKGEWIALLDSDDLWIKNKLERQEEEIKNNKNISFLGTSYPLKIYFHTYTSGLHKITAHQLCFRNFPTTPSIVFKKEVGLKLGLYDETMRYAEDINFYQKFLLEDSYYVLAEDLVRISVGKAFFAESGLSSNLKAMHLGRRRNTVQLYEYGLISLPYLVIMQVLNEMKYLRRQFIRMIQVMTNSKDRKRKNMFSVILPVCNCEKTITDLLDCVLRQSRVDLIEEVIVVNDGSTDNTKSLIDSYIAEHKNMRFHVINQERHGISYSRNIGIKKARAEMIALLDQDEPWSINMLEKQMKKRLMS